MTDDNTRRVWRLFLGVEGLLLLIAIAVNSVFFTFRAPTWAVILITILWTWQYVTPGELTRGVYWSLTKIISYPFVSDPN